MAGYRAWRHILFGLRSTWFAGGSVCAAGAVSLRSLRLGRRLRMEFRASFGWKSSSSTDAPTVLLYGVGSSVNALSVWRSCLSYEAYPQAHIAFWLEIAHYSKWQYLTAKSRSQSCGITPVGHISSAWYQALGSLSADWSGFRPGMSYDITLWAHGANGGYSPQSTNRIPARERLRCRDGWLLQEG